MEYAEIIDYGRTWAHLALRYLKYSEVYDKIIKLTNG